jgi:hypoxanthine phosphoribosyltransferase
VKQLLSEFQIREGVSRMAADLNSQYRDQPLTVLGVMTGSVVLLADLIRQLDMPLRVGVVQTSSYREGIEPGELRINSELMPDIRNRDVLLVDDIFDTGLTLAALAERIQLMQPKSLRAAVLLLKKGRQKVDWRPDFVGFEIPDLFVVGYGLDFRDHFRNLPFVAALDPDDLQRSNELP